jgi:hypothetical protein
MKAWFLAFALVGLVSVAACNKANSPTAPTPPPVATPAPAPPAPPPVVTATVAGVVTNESTRAPVADAAVSVSGGAYNGRSSTTDGNGYYSIPDVAGTLTLIIRREGYNQATRSVTVSGDTRADLTLRPFWTHSGTGNTVFDMPTVSRVRIIAVYEANSSNFIVRIGGRLVVNELLGRGWGMTRYDGTHLTSGGIVEITNSSGVQWSFAQVQ